jgi:hypothetical protein
LSGYIFGRVRVSNELAPAGNNPGQNNPARGPNANRERQRKQVRIGFGIFRPARDASLSLPAVSCVKLKNGAQGVDRRPYYFQISKSWESFSHAQLTPASTAGAWMPLRHPWTAAIHPGFG